MVQAGRTHSGLHHRLLGMLERVARVHMVGIGGSGMSGIAELLTNLGYEVTGSDLESSETTERLSALGVRIAEGHDAGHVGNADMVVVSSAVPGDNPEIVEAKRQAIPVVHRGAMLAELTGLRSGIAIVGSHGKTTTAGMLASILRSGGLCPSELVGGRRGGRAQGTVGSGDVLVLEADEFDGAFLQVRSKIALLTNAEAEHMDRYGDLEELYEAFRQFLKWVPSGGTAVVNGDDEGARAVVSGLDREVLSFGIGDGNDVNI